MLKQRKATSKNPLPQKHAMGCGVACVAFSLDVPYDKALALFSKPENAWTGGYMCRDLVAALNRAGLPYSFKYLKNKRDPILQRRGTIVFTRFSRRYPRGHYLVRAQQGWMNPWINFPLISPATAGFEKKLPAIPTYAIYLNCPDI